jgi:hypothetical protein
MTKAKIFALALIALGLPGCSTSTGILPMGSDTYTVHISRLTQVDSQAQATQEANDYCRNLGRQFLPINYSGWNEFSLTFRCLPRNDPELVRPIYGSVPNVVIENRR